MYIRKLSKITSLILLVCMTFTYILTPEMINASNMSNIINNKIEANQKAEEDISDDALNSIETNRFIIKYKDAKKDKGREKIKDSLKENIKAFKELKNKNFDIVITKNKIKHKDLISNLKDNKINDDIEYIQPDYVLEIQSNDLYFNEQWGLHNVFGYEDTVIDSVYQDNSKTADISIWNETQGEGIVVAIIDTGIDIEHEDLKNNIYVNEKEIPDNGIDDDGNGYVDDVNGWNFFDETNNVTVEDISTEVHGTHIAGIISAEKDNEKGIAGVAPKAKIMPLKVFYNSSAYTSDIIDAIEYAKENGAKIVNCSWGGSEYNDALKEIMEQSGLLFVCAAGNSRMDIDLSPIYPAAFDIGNIISVASIDRENNISSYSNFGQVSVDIAAPGENIISTTPNNSYDYLDGSSMATAFVTGEAAILLSSDDKLNLLDIKNRIIDSSNETNGIKRINIDRAILLTDYNNDETVIEDVYGETSENTEILEDLNIITDEENTVSEDVYLENEKRIQFSLIFDLLDKKEKYSELTVEEKELIFSVYNLDEEVLKECELKGYSLIDSINIALRVKEYELTIEDIENLLSTIKDIKVIDKELSKLKHFKERVNLTSDEVKTILNLLIEGYSIDSIKSAFIVSSALGLDITQVIIKSEEFNREEIIKSINGEYTEEEIRLIIDIIDNYKVRIIEVLNYAKQNNIQLREIKKKIFDYEIKRNVDSSDGYSLMADEEPVEEIDYEKYFSAPYNVKDNNSENISLNTGNLEYNNNLVSLSGINGLDLNIALKYESQEGALYETDYDIDQDYDYKVKKYETQYWSNWLGTEIYKPETLISTKNYETYSSAEDAAISWVNSSYTDPNHWEDGTDLIVDRSAEIIAVLDYRTKTNITNPNTYIELRNNLGSGWSLGFSSIEKKGSYKYLHLGNGNVYKIKITSTVGDSNLEKYTLKDMRLETDNGSYSNGEKASAYVLIYDNGTKEYFADDGRILAIQDRYKNTIKFQHTTINNNPVITKITDTLGRIINISYQTTTTGKKVVITAPDNTSVQCILEPISGYSNEYALKKIIDQEGRETTFDYSIDTGNFSFFSKSNRNKANIFANLTNITYPTGAITKYTYEKSVRNLTSDGSEEYYRILTREEIENSVSYNKESYSYSADNYTGYPTNNDPASLPTSFTYNTTITDSNNTKKIYTFNYKNLKINEQVKENGTTLLNENICEYDTNKLPTKVISKAYTPSTGVSLSKEVLYKYNEYGDLLEYTDELGYKTTYTYENSYHQLTSETKNINSTTIQKTEYGINSTNGNIDWKKQHHTENGTDKSIMTYYTYDSYGNILTEKVLKQDGSYIINYYEYSSSYNYGYMTRSYITVKDYNGNSRTIEEKYTYDLNTGNLKTHTNGNGKITTYEYDNLARLLKVINPDYTEKQLQYDDTSNIVIATDENGHQKRNIYDSLGRLIKKQEIKNNAWITLEENHYNLLGQVDWVKDGKGNTTKFEYDTLGRITKTINPDLTYTVTQYYDGENKIIELNEEGDYHYCYYDKKGNLTKEQIRPDKNKSTLYTTTYYYDYIGNLKKVIDANGNETSYSYDDLARLTSVTNALLETTKYEYDNLGNLIKTTTAKGSITSRHYDEIGRLIKEVDPLNKTEYIAYDGAGNITKKVDRKSQTISFTYDNRNRLKTESVGNITVSYTYDNVGNTLTMTDSTGTTKHEYYENGKLKKETQPDNKYICYEYDNNGNRTKMIDYFGKITTYTYDNRNRLKTVTADAKVTTYDYYPDGSRKSITYPNQVKEEYTYDGINNLLTLINKKADNTIISQYTYTYDNNSNQTSKKIDTELTSYTYDKLNRIKSVTEPTGELTLYNYDENGNILEQGKNIEIYPEILASVKKYNELNQLIEYTDAQGNKTTYTYDGIGRRKSKTTKFMVIQYYYDGQNVINETGNEVLIATNIRGINIIARQDNKGTTAYYLYNGHGDVVNLIQSDGSITSTYDYDIYGKEKTIPVGTIKNPYRYAAEYYDEESGLYYLRARYYDPNIGRFITEDTYKGDIKDPLSLNLYAYCKGNPIKYIDPSGHDALFSYEGLGGGGSPGGGSGLLMLLLHYLLDTAKDTSIDKTTADLTGEDFDLGNALLINMSINMMGPISEVKHLDNGVKLINKGSGELAEELSRVSVLDKLDRYLLNLEHPVGGSKAKWFRDALGFTKNNADDLAKQIVFDPNKAVQTAVTQHGIKYNQVISITGVNGKIIDVTFAWIKNNDGVVRLITGIPVKK